MHENAHCFLQQVNNTKIANVLAAELVGLTFYVLRIPSSLAALSHLAPWVAFEFNLEDSLKTEEHS